MYPDPSRTKKSPLRRFVFLLSAMVLLLVLLAIWRVGPAANIVLTPNLPAVGPSTAVNIECSEPTRGLVSVDVDLVQGDRSWPLDRKTYEPRPFWAFWGPATFEDQWVVEVGKSHQKELLPGPAELRVVSRRAGTWLRSPEPTTTVLPLEVRLTPPDLTVEAVSAQVSQGGSGAVVYRVAESATRHGLRIRDREIPGAVLGSGRSFLLFGAPHDLVDAKSEMRLFAEDELGNRVEQSFLQSYAERAFKEDDIRLSDGFFDDVVPEILAHTPEITEQGSRLDTYLLINDQLRKSNAERLATLSESSQQEFLWQGPFTQLPSSRAMAGFGDQRTYLYEGKAVDHQVHLGFDLASHRRAEIPAANRGVVVLAEYFGIYGKTVVIDHGYGLMSLYSHLSEIGVEVGRRLEQGETLGRTGATGLAGGDHLHFSVLVHGTQVNPLEWWDKSWIQTRILSLLEASEGTN